MLQWGRGLKTAEIRDLEDVSLFDYALQWGRGLKTAEMPVEPRYVVRYPSFNGAAV